MNPVADDTQVTFPFGDVAGESVALGVIPVATSLGGAIGLVVAETPFHPVDRRWPDQPGDTGTVTVSGADLAVVDTVIGAVNRTTGEAVAGDAVTARRGDDEWWWLVVHVLDPAAAAGTPQKGDPVKLAVDPRRRARLSAVHTACHLSGLMLNAELASLWRKDVAADSLGRPDFERHALTSSRHTESGYRDEYRLGRSLRKAGFDVDKLGDIAPDLGTRLTQRLADVVRTQAPVRIAVDGRGLSAVRTWTCKLPEGLARVGCGGTHPPDLSAIAKVSVRADLGSDGMFTVEGTVRARTPDG